MYKMQTLHFSLILVVMVSLPLDVFVIRPCVSLASFMVLILEH